MSDFARTFREVVGPRIRAEAQKQGVLVLLKQKSFYTASGAVMTFAMSRGAAYLPEPLSQQLQDFVDTEIMLAIEQHEQALDANPALAERIWLQVKALAYGSRR